LPEGSFVIDVDDDMPTAFDPDPITTGIENKAGETATADLDTDGNVDDNVGADQPGVIRFANIENGDDSGLESGEEPIEYWLSNDGQTLQGRVGSTNGTDGTLIFQIDLNQDQGPGDDTYTITMFDTIDNGAGVTFDNLTSTKAGNVDVRGVGADDPLTTVDLLLTASANGANATINTDSDSVGAANQSMDAGETVRIDFVTNLEDDPADDLATYPSGFSYDGHVGTQSLLQTIPQVQGSQTETVAFRVFALNTIVTDASSPDDTPDGVDPEFSDSTTVDITHVTVDGWDDGDPLDPGYPAEPAVTVALDPGGAWTEVAYGVWAQLQPDGSVIFTGIQQGDQYGIETGTDFNAVAVTALPSGTGPAGNESTEDSFDLGVFSIGQVDTGEPINLSYDLELTDADGDSVIVTDALQITIAPDAPDMALAATTESADTSSFSLLASDSQEGQVQKTAANSNTLTLATAVAAAGFVEPVAAHDNGNHNGHGQNSELASFAAPELVESYSASDGGDAAVSMLAPDSSTEASASADTSGSNSSDDTSADNSLDDSAAQAAPESNDAPAADDGGSNSSADAVGPVAPTVAMVSAEALEAAANDNGSAQQGGSVEQIVADALDQGGAADMDAVLANLPDGGNGGLQALAHMASPDAAAVSSWHTGGHGAVGAGFDMMFKMDVATHHQDAVQPVANG
jgi:hypothetical protein